MPEVLLSGDHKRILSLATEASAGADPERRPDLLAHRALSAEETQLLTELSGEEQCGRRL